MIRRSVKVLLAPSSLGLPILVESTSSACSVSSTLDPSCTHALRVASAFARFSSSASEGAAQKPVSRLDGMKIPGSSMSGAAISAAASAKEGRAFTEQQQEALNSAPPMPKFLGLAGALPFMSLTPFVVESLGFDTLVQSAALAQVAYGALIVSFLGAVHWGLAMASPMVGAKAAYLARERYLWSVCPALAAWPAVLMEPAPGSLCIAIMLGVCYMSDRAYGKSGALPGWYMALRGQLTTVATLSMLCTTAYFVARDVKKVKEMMAAEDARKAEQAAAPLAPPELAVEAPSPPKAKSKGWF